MSRLTILTAALAATAFASAALAENREVTVNNRTSGNIVQFFASNTGTNNWEEDILGVDVLAPGESVDVDIDDGTGACGFDFKAVFDDGATAVKGGVDVCEISEFDFTE
ncbi:hypothetical protein [Mangrovicella endophytica]|uniref:hypothetical protein n=1 Tax=Mangrovicella endophytica TaxID=2066697 RepID=UPI000C9DE23E|nr:hypothetical protein [Mangrovicella endophytica]